jgi:hypothetical protein
VDLQNEEIYKLYWLRNFIRLFKSKGMSGRSVWWYGRGDRQWERGETIEEFLWNPEVKGSVRRRWCKWKGEYKMDLQVIMWEWMDWIDLA